MAVRNSLLSNKPIRTLATYAVLTAALFVGLQGILPPESFAKSGQVTIVHSNNVTGHLFPCPT